LTGAIKTDCEKCPYVQRFEYCLKEIAIAQMPGQTSIVVHGNPTKNHRTQSVVIDQQNHAREDWVSSINNTLEDEEGVED